MKFATVRRSLGRRRDTAGATVALEPRNFLMGLMPRIASPTRRDADRNGR